MVVMDSRKRRDGAAIEELGWYNPIDEKHSYMLKEDKILNWLKEGAQTTEAAHKLLRRSGIAHRWHLINQGLKDAEIEKEMEKWKLNRENVLKIRAEKLENKVEKDTANSEDEKEEETKVESDNTDLAAEKNDNKEDSTKDDSMEEE